MTQDTEGVLEVEDRSGPGSCAVLVAIGLVTAHFTFGVGTILLLLWAFTPLFALVLVGSLLYMVLLINHAESVDPVHRKVCCNDSLWSDRKWSILLSLALILFRASYDAAQ